MAYFGVHIPTSTGGFEGTAVKCSGSIAAINIRNGPKYDDPEYPPDSPLWLIFMEKAKALDVLRIYKEGRLREFPNREQAESYVQFGFESMESLKRFSKSNKPVSKVMPVNSSSSSSSSPTAASSSPLSSMSNLLSNLTAPTTTNSSSSSSSSSNTVNSSLSSLALNAERQPFRAPTKQELVEFRKQIEAGNTERVKRIVWDNPRYLISSGDTPTSLKEGCRYNAMHICAQGNQARVAELLLTILADREFTQLYAGKKGSGEMCAALNDNLLDYYLNMPDKSRGETPLHFAVKNGHVAMVEVLTSYPQCKSLCNFEGKQPKDIICLRAPNANPELIKKLEILLADPHYVPVLRAVGNELPPQVGQPFTPNEPPLLQQKTDESEGLTVDLTISALAGPMPRDKAMNFYRRWKTPPRVGNNVMSPLAAAQSPFNSPIKTTPNKSIFNTSNSQNYGHSTPTGRRVLFQTRTSSPKPLNTQELNLESNNNNNVLTLPTTPLRQMKPELFFHYRSSESSPLGEDLSQMSLMDVSGVDASLNLSLNDSFRERHTKNSDIEKGLEVVGRQLARQEQLEWREYWDFLQAFVDIGTVEGLQRLEAYLQEQAEQNQNQAWNFAQMQQCLDLVTDRLITNNEQRNNSTTTQVMTPYTCVEKSLQVFAKRITKTLINNIGNMVSINDTLLSELKRLKSLIVSFKDDARFVSVDFAKVHTRIAHLVASYIAHSQEVSVAMRLQLLQMLRKLLQLHGERREHLDCVCSSLRGMLETGSSASTIQLPDALKTEESCSAAWEAEQSCACTWDANLSRKTSRRKRTESLRAQAQSDLAAQVAVTGVLRAGSGIAVVNPVAKALWRHDDEDEDSEDDEMYFFDCMSEQESGSSAEDEDELYLTPPQSNSPRRSIDLEPRYEIFIFGREPTKRDLDVLNAIFHMDVDKDAFPYVFNWKLALESYSPSEMDLFPSPKDVKKIHKPLYAAANAGVLGTPKTYSKRLISTPKLNAVANRGAAAPPTPPLYAAANAGVLGTPKTYTKRLISTPNLNAVANRGAAAPPTAQNGVSTPEAVKAAFAATVSQSFQTPLNKVRGLFSKYREPRPPIDSPIINGGPSNNKLEDSD